MEQRSLAMARADMADESLGLFRWGRFGSRILVSSDAGDWAFLTDSEFADLLSGRVIAGHPRFVEFQRKGFLRDGFDLEAFAARIARRNRHIRRGPHLHVVTLATRAGDQGQTLAMSAETAEKIVEVALDSESAAITFELQGDLVDPLINFAAVARLVESARSRNQRTAGKALRFRLLSSFAAMTEEIAEWLVANEVLICTSLDGPAKLHDANRRILGGTSHAEVVGWIEFFQRRYTELKRDPQQWQVEALMTTTRASLEAWRDVVDEYVARGLRSIHLRPLAAAQVGPEAWRELGYAFAEYAEFYRRALDYLLELNQRGVPILERTAATFAAKILGGDDPGVVDLQSPNGAGTGQVAYDVLGRLFPCDEARRVDVAGDSIFALGDVRSLSLTDVLQHPTVRAIAAASLLDAQPMCADCWNKPFCGISPVLNYLTNGDLFGQRPHSLECKEHMAVAGRLFELLSNEGDAAAIETLNRWAAGDPWPVVDRRLWVIAP